ncbi:MAG: (Fe-S)-binding protein [Candidatus Methanomethylicia archaeon]|nr:(Fe-S)-binding protein [Candidatus Methanomethylicia archaeon]
MSNVYPKSFKHIEDKLKTYKIPQQCIHCGTCRTYYQSKFWNPVCPSGQWKLFDPYYLSGKMQLAMGLIKGRIKWSKEIANPFFECTLCGNCSEQCHVVETDGRRPIFELALPLLEAVRADAVANGFGPDVQRKYCEAIVEKHNPYNEPHEKRTAWLKEALGEDAFSKNPDYVLFLGCTSSYRQKNIALATAKIFQKLGLKFTVMDDEYCCGSPILRTGRWEPVADLAKHNFEEVRKTGAKTVVTSCPGCFKVWSHDYAKENYGGVLGIEHDFKVLHTTELLSALLKEGKLKFSKPINAKVTFHDPCHMGRNLGEKALYDPPREILKAIPGVEFVEMERVKNVAWCCGSGGGVKSAFPEFAIWTGKERVNEALSTGASVLASTCPFCQRNLDDSAKAMATKIDVTDVVEMVEKAL